MVNRSDRYNNKYVRNSENLKNKKTRKIKYKKIFVFFSIIAVIAFLATSFFLQNITNIYISGNKILTEKEIIEIAQISDYPNTFLNLSSLIENRLEKNIYIKEAKVYKKSFTILYITVEENRPIFYNETTSETVLLDGSTVKQKMNSPTLVNIIPDTLYEKFVEKMSQIKIDVLNKISEIKYDKNDVDETRFLFTMNDGNYVYLTLNTFENINNYMDIIKKFNNSKGVLYLDSGGYFQIFEN